MKASLFACGLLAGPLLALEVHEWGTFTVLSGSNGIQVPWYSGEHEVAKLPAFVHGAYGGKVGVARIRMETPVIYFYPEKTMEVSVEARFMNGMITEAFPVSLGKDVVPDRFGNGPGNVGSWGGTLHPPGDRKALSHVPAIPPTKNEEPYGAAREVPDAWIFESDVKRIPGLDVQPPFPEMEKFIFYRGIGDAFLPITATVNGQDGEGVTVVNQAHGPLAFGTALRVRGDKASWVVVPEIPQSPSSTTEPSMNHMRVTLPTVDRALDEVESELAAAWKTALEKDGLTATEASAMVETWRRTWFREEGDRVLTLVPRATIDSMLSLDIKPQPARTERVFVARIEMVSPEKEQSLVHLLNSETTVGPEDREKIKQLGLGRFVRGAVEIATEIQMSKMRSRSYALTAPEMPPVAPEISRH